MGLEKLLDGDCLLQSLDAPYMKVECSRYSADKTDKYSADETDCYSIENAHKRLNEKGFSDDRIRLGFCVFSSRQNKLINRWLEDRRKAKAQNKLRLQALKKISVLPPKEEMDNLLRYETAINRQMNQAINQLERLQRRRLGDHVPAPVQVDVNTLGPGDLKLV